MATIATADLSDALADAQVIEPPWNDYGGRVAFSGPAATVRCHDDNSKVREMLETPGEGRVLVVNEAARMDADEAASRLLKSLEEPGPDAHVILVTDRIDDLLPTIRSRCLPVPFRAGPPGAAPSLSRDQISYSRSADR